MQSKLDPPAARYKRYFGDLTVPELLAIAQRHIESAERHFASAKRHEEEFDRLERLRGVPLFRRW